MKYIFKKKNCRLCNSDKIYKTFELCKSPLANNLAKSKKDSLNAKRFPLNIIICSKCHHLQLEHVVNYKILYDKYLYMTGISKGFRNHFKNYAEDIVKEFKNKNNLKVLEIGSNDCILLDYFKKRKWTTAGVEPAKNLYKITKNKHEIINDYYNIKTHNKLRKKFNKFDLIVANNVFAHINNLKSVFNLIKKLMHNESLIVFEVSYLLDVIKKKLFDTIYHEHLDYHSIIPLMTFFKNLNLKIIDIKRLQVHGGSIRILVTKDSSNKKTNSKKIDKLMYNEFQEGLTKKNTYLKFYDNLVNQRKQLNNFFLKYKDSIIYGYGAPAKAVTFINFFNLNHNNLRLIIDDSPIKQNKYIPGTQIKIFNSKILVKKPPKFIVILAWNVYEDILKKINKYNNIKYAVIPLPKFKLIKL